MVTVENNVIIVKHGTATSPQEVSFVIEKMMQEYHIVSQKYHSTAILHDARELRSASENYAQQFGEAFLQLDEGVRMFAVVPSAFMRVMAAVASKFGGRPIKVFKTMEAFENEKRVDPFFQSGLIVR